jgi:hypothetical protein
MRPSARADFIGTRFLVANDQLPRVSPGVPRPVGVGVCGGNILFYEYINGQLADRDRRPFHDHEKFVYV